jgi:hypothetical protein
MTPDEPQEMDPSARQPSEEEMRAALEEELKRVRVEQVVLEATVSILNVAVMRSGLVPGSEAERDPDQMRLGIEAVRSLMPIVEHAVGPEQAKPIRDALSQLQMAYVRAAQSAGAGGEGGGEPDPGGPGGATGGGEPATPKQPVTDQSEAPGPAQQSGRLWVPGQ